jgi:DNA-binding transcriptional regulator GbsR (MarR family)
MEGHTTLEYRFNTYQSFEISQLVDYNKCVNNTLHELEKDDHLIAQANQYKQELEVYLNTCDSYDKGMNQVPTR